MELLGIIWIWCNFIHAMGQRAQTTNLLEKLGTDLVRIACWNMQSVRCLTSRCSFISLPGFPPARAGKSAFHRWQIPSGMSAPLWRPPPPEDLRFQHYLGFLTPASESLLWGFPLITLRPIQLCFYTGSLYASTGLCLRFSRQLSLSKCHLNLHRAPLKWTCL